MPVFAQYQMENISRGLVAVRNGSSNFISWRWLGNENDGITFNLYRDGTKVNSSPLTVCNYTDNGASATAKYNVKALINNVEQPSTDLVSPWSSLYKTIPLKVPAGGKTPDGVSYTYSPNDCSVGDVDGDGEYEIFVKWDPSNSKDNSQAGYTGNVYIDCYKMSGTFLWRIDLGRNIRAGAHYTQFLVYDFDGDGRAEMACKTADATVDGKGVVIGSSSADYRNSKGYVLSGPEFLTVFNGATGAAMATANYTPARGTVSSWGDSYGNRVDRFIAAVAYLDGQKPSMVFGRGYYTRLVRAAWDWRNGKLTQRWIFDSNVSGNGGYKGQGNHQMTVADFDGDGKQEICNGASIIDDNGAGMYATAHGHGDALHMSDMDPDRPGYEIWQCNEEPAKYGNYSLEFKEAKTGKAIFAPMSGNQGDVGRAMAADIDPRYKGYEMWAMMSTYNMWNCKGVKIASARPSVNFAVYWDGDLQRELLDGSNIDKWDYMNSKSKRMVTFSDAAWGYGTSCNTTKATPNLSADLFGDWREEVILHSSDNKNLLIYTTTIPSDYKFRTLMHDPTYRVAIAWQNSCYNQPPHPGFYLGGDMDTPAKPNITIVGAVKDCNGVLNGGAYIDDCSICVGGNTGKTPCYKDCNGVVNGKANQDACGICVGGNTGKVACSSAIQGEDFCDAVGVAEDKNVGFINDGYLNLDNAVGSNASWYVISASAQSTKIGIRYANGAATARGVSIAINGNIQATLLGNTTGSWTTWTEEYFTVNLLKGANKVTFTSTGVDGGPNIDLISFNTASVTGGGCTADCKGVIGGGAFIDECGTCAEGTTGVTACTQDCHGDWGGTAVLDDCEVCVGGKTNLKPCTGNLEAEEACSVDGILLESTNTAFSGAGYVNTTNAVGSSVKWILNSPTAQTVSLSFRYANGSANNRDGALLVNGVFADTLKMPTTSSWSSWDFAGLNVPLKQGANEISVVATSAEGLANLDLIAFSSNVTNANCLVTATDEISKPAIYVYPNPTHNKVKWNSVENWTLINAQGIELQKGKGMVLDLSSYPDGMYMLKMTEKTFEIIKQ